MRGFELKLALDYRKMYGSRALNNAEKDWAEGSLTWAGTLDLLRAWSATD